MFTWQNFVTSAASVLVCGTGFAASLELTVENINEAGGSVLVGIYRVEPDDDASKEGTAWQKKSVGGHKLAVSAPGKLLTTIDNLPDGEYGLSLFWDKNDNGKLDKNMLGMPLEPYAFSNNARGQFGPPTWKQVAFIVKGDTKVSVRFD